MQLKRQMGSGAGDGSRATGAITSGSLLDKSVVLPSRSRGDGRGTGEADVITAVQAKTKAVKILNCIVEWMGTSVWLQARSGGEQ